MDPDDCGTLRFAGADSDLSDQEYVSVYPSDPCAGRDSPSGRDQSTDTVGGTDARNNAEDDDPEPQGISTIFESVKHILRYAAGLAEEPNRFVWPYTENDAATMELTDSNYTMVASPPEGCDIPTSRHLTIEDAVLFLKIAFSYQTQAVWSMDFLGNPQLGGNAANSTGMPAIANIDSDTKLEAVFVMGMRNGTNYYAPRYTGNPNQVYVLKDLNNNGTFGLKLGGSGTPGFPQPLRDAPSGVAIANIVGPASGTDNPEIIASNFQDTFDINGVYLGDLYSRPYVWDTDGRGISPFAHSDNPDGTPGMAVGHTDSASAVWDVDKDGRQEVFFPAIGHYDRLVYKGTHGGSIQRLQATRNGDGTVSVTTRAIQEANTDGKWLTEPDVPDNPNTEEDEASSSHGEFQTPPVMLRTTLNDANSDRTVAAVSVAGDVYGWDKNGNRAFYFQTDDIIQTVNDQ